MPKSAICPGQFSIDKVGQFSISADTRAARISDFFRIPTTSHLEKRPIAEKIHRIQTP